VYNSPDVLSPFLILTLHQFLISPTATNAGVGLSPSRLHLLSSFQGTIFFSFCCNLQLAQICDRIFTS
jgi:hypothetical protein